MNAIVVVDENWCIGKDGGLLVHLSKDLKYFKEKTIGKTIIVGRKTLESFPGGKPLPGRKTIVLTRNASYKAEGAYVCHSKEEVLEKVKDLHPADVFVAGGGAIYRQFLDDVDKVFVTKIYNEYSGDTFFPNLDEDKDFVIESERALIEENGVKFKFCIYNRI